MSENITYITKTLNLVAKILTTKFGFVPDKLFDKIDTSIKTYLHEFHENTNNLVLLIHNKSYHFVLK